MNDNSLIDIHKIKQNSIVKLKCGLEIVPKWCIPCTDGNLEISAQKHLFTVSEGGKCVSLFDKRTKKTLTGNSYDIVSVDRMSFDNNHWANKLNRSRNEL